MAERPGLSQDQVDLPPGIRDHDVESTSPIPGFGDCSLTDGVALGVELGDQAIERVSIRVDHDVDVVCRTRVAVIGAREGPGQHVRDSGSVEFSDAG
ncbi:MAG: hypothetical protein QF570_13070 [Myxococcota bacterium]|nr:hypothetical protein [Myxococcota bacterium]